jgi:hypothetical protein
MASSAMTAGDERTVASINPDSSVKDITPKRKPKLTHKMLDRAFVASLVLLALKSRQSKKFLKDVLSGLKSFGPPLFNWKKQPMNRFVAVSVADGHVLFDQDVCG